MYKIGVSTCGNEITESLFQKIKESGIEAIEISGGKELYDRMNYPEIKLFSINYNVELWSFHLPFAPFTELEISTGDTVVREHTIQYFSDLIRRGADIGIDKFVIHPSGEPIKESDREERIKYAQQSLSVLADIALSEGAVIAVEDLPRTCLGNTAKEIQKLIGIHNNLRVCFDTNHLLQESPVDFINNLGKKIVTTHISDYDFINERHWLPGEGKIDWRELYKAFEKTGYDGVWLYELNLSTPDTIIRNRELVYHDFVTNAHEIFEYKNPTIFSKNKENLGFWG